MRMSINGLSNDIVKAIKQYYKTKNRIGNSIIDKEASLIDCSDFLLDVYLGICGDQNWQNSPCHGGDDTGIFHGWPLLKKLTDTTKTNVQQFNSEVEFLVTEYKGLPQPVLNDPNRATILSTRADVIKKFQTLCLAENKTDCALSVLPTSPVNIYSEQKEYRLAKKVYLRTENLDLTTPLRYINRIRPAHQPKNIPIPAKRNIWDQNSRTHRTIPMTLAEFDNLSGITEIKNLPITGKVLSPEELDNLTTLMGKSIPKPFVPLSRLPEHIAEETCCCHCVIL